MTMQESIQELMAFLDYSVTSYHAVEMLQNTLRQEGLPRFLRRSAGRLTRAAVIMWRAMIHL